MLIDIYLSHDFPLGSLSQVNGNSQVYDKDTFLLENSCSFFLILIYRKHYNRISLCFISNKKVQKTPINLTENWCPTSPKNLNSSYVTVFFNDFFDYLSLNLNEVDKSMYINICQSRRWFRIYCFLSQLIPDNPCISTHE